MVRPSFNRFKRFEEITVKQIALICLVYRMWVDEMAVTGERGRRLLRQFLGQNYLSAGVDDLATVEIRPDFGGDDKMVAAFYRLAE